MATKNNKSISDKRIENKLKHVLKGDSNFPISSFKKSLTKANGCPQLGSKTAPLTLTIEDSVRMKAAGIHTLDELLHIRDEVKTFSSPVDQEKLKSQAKKNHLKLKTLKQDDFEHTGMKLKSSLTTISLDTSSTQSTSSSNSSSEGSLTGWMLSWSLNSSSRKSDDHSIKYHSTNTGDIDSKPTIKRIKDGCFLRKDSSLVVTEPQANRIRVFSRKKGNLLATIDDKEWSQKSWTDNNDSQMRFCPAGVCETETNNVLAVTDRNKMYYVRVAGPDSTIEAEVKIKNRSDLLGIACTNQSNVILLDSGITNKPFVGCFDSSGKIIREFKGTFTRPSYITWNDYYQVAAIVDCGQRNILFYDIDGKLLNTISSSNNNNNINDLSYPTGITWTSHSQLLVADKAINRILSFDFRAMRSENVLDISDGVRDPVVVACDYASKNLLITEEELMCGRKDAFRLNTYRRHGVPKVIHEGLFF